MSKKKTGYGGYDKEWLPTFELESGEWEPEEDDDSRWKSPYKDEDDSEDWKGGGNA